MKRLIFATAFLTASAGCFAQTSGASAMQPSPITQDCVTVPYRISDEGTKLPDITWGLDLAWLSEGNVQRGVNFAGQELIDIIRLSFQTTNTEALNGSLTNDQKKTLNERIAIVKKHAPKASINLNSDQMEGTLEQVTSWYRSSNSITQANRWCELIALTKRYVEANGLKVVSVSPFNEPDLEAWHQGTKNDFTAICKKFREDQEYKEEFQDILLCGGNTLNDDQALSWYNASKKYLDEGNTHQLAGSFDNFAKFYQTVAKDGKVGVGDELHNTMECMVGSEYGLTKGIWWGTCDHTRSQFMKASRGNRLAYAEHRNNWTAAGIYRHPGGLVEAFGGTSERQAYSTTYRLTATDHDVFYNGLGPTREYMMFLPGGTGYQQGQTNAETCVVIQDGEDIMPALPTEATTYRLVNRGSGRVISMNNNNLSNGGSMTQESFATGKAATKQSWIVRPVGPRAGGDFSYYKIMNASDTTMLIDVKNWSLEDRASLIGYRGGVGTNEIWYLEYVEDGWFYIRSCHSALCIEVTPATSESSMKLNHRALCQGKPDGSIFQQWRLLPADVTYNSVAPAEPSALRATAQSASVRLTWQAPEDQDLDHYIVQRSTDQQTWYTIHNSVPTAEYTDNTVEPATTYFYRVKAVDQSQNRSAASNVVSAAAAQSPACICHLPFDSDLSDATHNGNHGALYGTRQFAEGKLDSALVLNGASQFLQLPSTVANSQELTVALWVYWQGTKTNWQRIFDFGLDDNHYVFLTPKAATGARLAIKNGGKEQYINISGDFGTDTWRHVAVTFSADAITVFFDGQQVATNTSITMRPADFRPVYNYIGRSQFATDPLLRGMVDDVRIYNYSLSAADIAQIAALSDGVATLRDTKKAAQGIYTLDGVRVTPSQLQRGRIYVIGNRKVRF
jgi:hypothetical protein